MNSDEFKTIAALTQAEYKVKGSQFIGRAKPATSREEAEHFIGEIRKLHHDATHNCFAYQIGVGQQSIMRQSDDGEPSGTAGKPILQAITSRELTNIVLMVTRYFGGIKLGTGGLIRAYGTTASATMEKAEIKLVYLTSLVEIEYPYEMSGVVSRTIERFHAEIKTSSYDANVHLQVAIRQSLTETLISHLTEESSGKIIIHK